MACSSAVRWIGGAYLVWLGVRTFLGRSSVFSVTLVPDVGSAGRMFANGFVLQAANPKGRGLLCNGGCFLLFPVTLGGSRSCPPCEGCEGEHGPRQEHDGVQRVLDVGILRDERGNVD